MILTATRYARTNSYWMGWYDNSQKSIVALYDIAIPSQAKLIRFIEIDGSLSDSRLEDNGLFTLVATTSYWIPPYYRMV